MCIEKITSSAADHDLTWDFDGRYNFDQLEKSHFERLYMQAQDSIKGIFHYQYRMHPDISAVIGNNFYGNKLVNWDKLIA